MTGRGAQDDREVAQDDREAVLLDRDRSLGMTRPMAV